MIDSGKYSKYEIKGVLSRFIKQRGEICPNAANIWREDLEFVNNYKLQNQEKVTFK